MKTIRISEGVWKAIAAKGKFGETEDDVLCRVFGIEKANPVEVSEAKKSRADHAQSTQPLGWKKRRTTVPMFQRVEGNKFILEFQGRRPEAWDLPSKNDATGIRRVRDLAIEFVRKNGGTTGQVGAAMRALTSRGYHVTLKNQRRTEYI